MDTLQLLNEMADKEAIFKGVKQSLIDAFGSEYVSVYSLTVKNLNRLDRIKHSIFMNEDLQKVLECADILKKFNMLDSPNLLRQFSIFIRPFEERNASNAKPFSPSRDYFKRD